MLNITNHQEMQIKTKMRHHLTSVRMATISKSINNQGWWECGERGTLVHYWWGCRLVQQLWKAAWSYPPKLKMELPYDPLIPFVEIYQKYLKDQNLKEHMHPYIHFSIIYSSQGWTQPKCPQVDEQIKSCGTLTQWNSTWP